METVGGQNPDQQEIPNLFRRRVRICFVLREPDARANQKCPVCDLPLGFNTDVWADVLTLKLAHVRCPDDD